VSAEPRRIGHYAIERMIARTSHSTVYLAQHEGLGRSDAVKEETSLTSQDGIAQQRFIDEARIAARLSHHPNVVTVYDAWSEEGAPWIAMEYFARGTLEPYAGRLTPRQVTRVADSVLSALIEAQRHGVVHRDLKPQNLMLTGDGDVKVADFGIAKVTDASRRKLTQTGEFTGSPAYVAPEVVRGIPATAASDLYSLAIVFHELLTGAWPFNDAASVEQLLMRKTRDDPPSLRGAQGMPDGIGAVVEHLGRHDPSKRYASAEEARVELREAAALAWGADWRTDSIIPPDPGPLAAPATPAVPQGSRFASYATVTASSGPRRVLTWTATRPFNVATGALVTLAAWRWEPAALWVGPVAYVALVALTFFDLDRSREIPARGRHAPHDGR
jgi:serine/threonine protein kinase